MGTKPTIIPLAGHVFEDTIDGYFPLQESLKQMMERQGFVAAIVSLVLAPAMEIPELAPADPVPLYVTVGFGCMINRMSIVVRCVDGKIETEGLGNWKWFDGPSVADRHFSSLHRLAEPAFVQGVGFKVGALNSSVLGSIEKGSLPSDFALLRLDENEKVSRGDVLQSLGWTEAQLFSGSLTSQMIASDEDVFEASKFKLTGETIVNHSATCDVVLCRDGKEFGKCASFMIAQHWRAIV